MAIRLKTQLGRVLEALGAQLANGQDVRELGYEPLARMVGVVNDYSQLVAPEAVPRGYANPETAAAGAGLYSGLSYQAGGRGAWIAFYERGSNTNTRWSLVEGLDNETGSLTITQPTGAKYALEQPVIVIGHDTARMTQRDLYVQHSVTGVNSAFVPMWLEPGQQVKILSDTANFALQCSLMIQEPLR